MNQNSIGWGEDCCLTTNSAGPSALKRGMFSSLWMRSAEWFSDADHRDDGRILLQLKQWPGGALNWPARPKGYGFEGGGFRSAGRETAS